VRTQQHIKPDNVLLGYFIAFPRLPLLYFPLVKGESCLANARGGV